jgi:hypothetical protein
LLYEWLITPIGKNAVPNGFSGLFEFSRPEKMLEVLISVSLTAFKM